MPWLDTSNKTFSLLIKIVVLVILICAALWFCLSILGNTLLADRPPDLPDVEKARYQFIIKNTGRYIFTDDYSEHEYLKGICYDLHGYYELSDGKYRWHDKDLMLCKSLFGDIQVKKR